MSETPRRIGIALVRHGDRFLIGVRHADQTLPGLHEFPGGKCEHDESPAECAVRECREETGLFVQADRELHRQRHTYSHAEVELHFWLCRPVSPDDVQTEHRGFTWTAAEDLPRLHFPEANAAVVKMLVESG